MNNLMGRLRVFVPLVLIMTLIVAKEGLTQEGARYPARPVNIIVPMSSGTSSDLGVRLLAKETEKYLDQPIIVVNKAGGGGPMVEAGQTRLLLSFMEKRSEDFPQIPVLKDLGYDILCPSMNGLFAPRDISDDIVKKLEESFSKGMKEPAFVKGVKDLHLPIFYRNSRDLEDYMARTYEVFSRILEEMGLVNSQGERKGGPG